MSLTRDNKTIIEQWLISPEAPDAKRLGRETANALHRNATDGEDQKATRIMTQIRGIQNLVYSTNRFSDIEESIWSRMGRDTKKTSIWWEKVATGAREPELGHRVLTALTKIRDFIENENELKKRKLEARIYAARLWIRRFVASYLFHRNS